MLFSANSHKRALFGLAAALVLQTASCFSVPMTMALRRDADRQVSVSRRDALSAVLFAAGGQVAAFTLLQPKRSYEKPSEFVAAASKGTPSTVATDGQVFSEQEAYKFERRLRKVNENLGKGDMERIAEAMGNSFNCMASDLCPRGVWGFPSGYE